MIRSDSFYEISMLRMSNFVEKEREINDQPNDDLDNTNLMKYRRNK